MNWIVRRPGLVALILVIIASARIVSTYRALSHTTDEPAHLAAGIEWIENGTYTYEDQHPPLARVAGALGAHLIGSRWSRNKSMYDEGYHILGQNKRYNQVLFFSRLCMLPFFWIGCAAVWFWGLRIGGTNTAQLSVLLFTTTPPILAHAGLVTTDMALTSFVTATLVASLYWVSQPDWRRSLVLGTVLGLALLSKFSALVFLPGAWLLMCIAWLWRVRRGIRSIAGAIKARIGRGAVTAMVTLLIIWAGYRFDIGRVDYLKARMPAPAFFTGLQSVYLHNGEGHLAYLLGTLNHSGFWYYYPVVVAVKTPLATLILVVFSVWFAVRHRKLQAIATPVASIATPVALILTLLGVGFFSHINIGVRHILPIYAAFALCGGVALSYMLGSKQRWLTGAAIVLLSWQVLTGILVHPDYLAYTNELAGSHPERILADSDLDWDQGMRGLALRLEELNVQNFTFKANSSGYLIANGHWLPAYELMPDGDQPRPGWNAVCITGWKLSGQPRWADRIEPTERIRRSILLYYIPAEKKSDARPISPQ